MKTTIVERILFYLLIFFLPTQLAYHFWPDFAFVFGVRVDYLSPTIYLTDVLILYLLTAWTIRNAKEILQYLKKCKNQVLILLLFVFLNLSFSDFFWISLFRWLKIFLLIAFSFYVYTNQVLVRNKLFIKVFSASLITTSLIGVLQFFLGQTIGGPFYFLGERSFNVRTPGIALQSIFNSDYLRPYSTFSHPNSLSGFLVVAIMFLTSMYKSVENKSKNLLSSLTAFVTTVCFFLTSSLSSFVGILLSLGLNKYSRFVFGLIVLASLLMPVFSSRVLDRGMLMKSEIEERFELSEVSGKLISNNFLFGVGLNSFIPSSQFRLLQPAHNVFLLALTETGVVGFLVLGYLILKLLEGFEKSKNIYFRIILIFVLTTSFFDHYWITLQQNLLLLSLIIPSMMKSSQAALMIELRHGKK